ncbi:uncharacterized protein C16C10.8 [Orussus abietinus]|uniref:uncharacterized protein C16C10.8 n=1 Tax=Orussus abietinus TaxID=222816 RepID=UPI000625EBFD|nr:uncharacterized protein C16C10.8 [Orussus abietinus]XP_012281576.1 uncharacterized protein C16C10.8 [Orussus abietinus]XP_012281577.1 uncharacterized protein C16C10.8 [Orussus abietinus]XP_012281578.1 uncharacterized protein C16C10.8 [Orussus abietinus]XP_012281579.1 uncharacterized protein C16C10.8 [Orussus abietinus]XP_012281580.1 uncharacterized protein C16C10.8 [Orussus abietinus]XP_012281581.1 uncharacterized protein C16C10.8 [Orussus abietinus]XP_012281584.1 uncharacterized protein 
MVVFTCNHCGESLNKPKVEKHYLFKCFNPKFVTCVDCLKDFRDEEFVAHTKCISENERYGGKGYVPKPNANKGERKQQEWINVVKNVLANSTDLTTAERSMLNTLSKHENIPRRKTKFLNFINSIFGNKVPMYVVDSVWNKMELSFKATTESYENTQKTNEDKEVDTNSSNDALVKDLPGSNIAENENNENLCKENKEPADKQKKKKKRQESMEQSETDEQPKADGCTKNKSKKRRAPVDVTTQEEQPVIKKVNQDILESVVDSSIIDLQQTEQNGINTEFDWKNSILETVRSKGEISLRKLKKKVVTRYLNHCSNAVAPEKAESKFAKKLGKLTNITVNDGKVTLI